MGNLLSELLEEAAWDGGYMRFALIVTVPFLAFLAMVR